MVLFRRLLNSPMSSLGWFRFQSAIGFIAALLMGAIVVFPGKACLPIGRYGAGVEVAEETAIILWDAETKTEHFIRRARFISDAKDIGFLVPTPTKPELVEVDNHVFNDLAIYTDPPPPAAPSRGGLMPNAAPKSMPDPVKVLETKTVAGLDATILAADDAKALTEWLKKNDYPTNEETQAWLEPYLKEKWIITAYKINNENGKDGMAQHRFQTSTVRMSFKADKPFYPYREPRGAGKGLSDRLLRVYFLSQEAHDAKLLETRWETNIPFANRLNRSFQNNLARSLKLPAPLETVEPWFLTEFEDRATVRKPGGEVVFVAKPDMVVHERPKAASFGWSGSSNTTLASTDREAFKALVPVALAAFALVVFFGWAIFRKRGSVQKG